MLFIKLVLSIDEIKKRLDLIFTRTHESIISGGEQIAEEMKQYAKKNAPWTDRTGNARRTLDSVNKFGWENTSEENIYFIGVCGNMPYSPDLELKYKKKYAILGPTVKEYSDDMLENIRNVISRQEGIG